jgi:hypothetical protein
MLTFDDGERLFVGNTFCFNKFDDTYHFIFLEHATDLFTPKQLLSDIKNILKTESSLIHFNAKQLKKYLCNNQQKTFLNLFKPDLVKRFEQIYGNDYELYILYCDPINEISRFSYVHRDKIKQYFSTNRYCPAARFFNDNYSIIVLNSNVVTLDGNELELQLDHELNHLFDKLIDKKYPDLNVEIQQDILKYFSKLNKEIDMNDFSMHMFSSIEFYEMLANLCNVVSLYFNETDNFKIFKKLMSMLNEEYLESVEFNQLDSQMQGAIIFAFICKKYSKARWNKVISSVKKQLELTGVKNSLNLCLNELQAYLKKFINS